LIELLVVVAIVGTLMAVAVPALSGILGGRGVEKAITSVSGVVDLARATAVSRRSYVYVLFQNATSADGKAELRVAAFQSVTGRNSNNTNDLVPISKLVKIPQVLAARRSDLPTTLKSYVSSSAADLMADSLYVGDPARRILYGGPKPTVGETTFTDNDWYFALSPDGEILSGGNLMFQTLVCVGLAPAKGTQVQTNAKDGAVVAVYGGSGKLRIERP
jgi:type II secretory pathway pseudopilin PulG